MQRGTPSKNRSFFSTGGSDKHTPRTPADVSWIREQAGTTPRALDRDFLAASPGTPATADVGAGSAKQATSATKGKMFNRRTWTKDENEQLQEGMASLGGPEANLGKNVSEPLLQIIPAIDICRPHRLCSLSRFLDGVNAKVIVLRHAIKNKK